MSRRTLPVILLVFVGLIVFLLFRQPSDFLHQTSSESPSRVGTAGENLPASGSSGTEREAPADETPAGGVVATDPEKRQPSPRDTVLTVVVVDAESRRPIEGATVRIEWLDQFDRQGLHRATLVTDSGGEVSTHQVPGLYGVQVSREGYSQYGRFMGDPGREPRKGAWVGLREGGGVKTVAMVPTVTVTGRVENDRGEALGGVPVHFRQDGIDLRRIQAGVQTGTGLALVTSDDSGRFEVELEKGTYQVRARRQLADTSLEDVRVAVGMKPLTIVLPAFRDLVEIGGRIVSDSGEGLEGARITFHTSKADEESRYLFGDASRAGGVFDAAVPPDTPLRLEVRKAGYENGRYDQSFAGETDITIVLKQFQRFRVRVFDADGREIQRGFKVSAFNLEDPPREVMRPLPDEENMYYAWSYPVQIQAEAHTQGEGRSAAQVIERHQPEVVLHLERGSARLRGRVVDADARPVSLFVVGLRCAGALKMSVVPFFSDDGAFQLDGLHAGDCSLGIMAPLLMLADARLTPYRSEIELRDDEATFVEVKFNVAVPPEEPPG